MHLALRDGISWCLCGSRVILLDLPADRYFGVDPGLEPVFLRWSSGDPGLAQEELERLAASGLFLCRPGRHDRAPATIVPPEADLLDSAGIGAEHVSLASVLLVQSRAEWRLRRWGPANAFRLLPPRRRLLGTAEALGAASGIARAFERSALVLPKADHCLRRALAAMSLCRRRGVPAALVLGVRLDPFSAHGWTQLGKWVIVGEFEQARLFTPILVQE